MDHSMENIPNVSADNNNTINNYDNTIKNATKNATNDEINDVFYLATFSTMYKVGEAINNYYYPVLVLVGIVGNILSFLVMVQPHNRRMSLSLYLAAIAVADTIPLIQGFLVFLSLGQNVKIPPSQFSYCTTSVTIYFMASLSSISFITSMTFDRFYSIIKPHKAASFNTVKRAKITIVCIVVISILLNIPHLYITSHQGWLCLPFGNVQVMARSYSKFYYWFSFTIQFGLPFVLLLIMNSFIIHTLRTRSKLILARPEGQGQNQGQSSKVKSSEKQVYIILLLVTFAFMILTTPGYMFFIINLLVDFTTSPETFAGYFLFSNVAQKLSVTNFAINFFLYVISGKKFRTDLINLFRIKANRADKNLHSITNPDTNVSTLETSH